MESIQLPQGPVYFRDTGSGPPLVFVHGLLVNGSLWRKVVPLLEGEFRCIVPDLPLGSHATPMRPEADLSPPGQARLIADFLEALGLQEVTLVANDTGGGIAQILATEHPERLAGLVLTPCDAFENFLPPLFRPLQLIARIPGMLKVVIQPLRLNALRRLPNAFGWLTKRRVEREVTDEWLRPCLSDRKIRRDTEKLLRGISRKQTLAAAAKLPQFNRPALIAWAEEDRVFPFEHAERLAALIPDSRLEPISDSYSFVPEDRPDRLAELVSEFVHSRVAVNT